MRQKRVLLKNTNVAFYSLFIAPLLLFFPPLLHICCTSAYTYPLVSVCVCVTLLYEALRLLLAPNTPCFTISRLNCRCVINEYKAGKSLLISISYSAGGSAEAATVTARRRYCLGTKTPGIIKALHLSEYLSHLKSNRSFPQLALSFISSWIPYIWVLLCHFATHSFYSFSWVLLWNLIQIQFKFNELNPDLDPFDPWLWQEPYAL